jgi:dCTP deaminase
MAILTRSELIDRLSGKREDPIVVTPLLHKDQVGPGSIDVRLANDFLLATRSVSGVLAYKEGESAHPDYPDLYRKTRREFGIPFYLHPNQLVLGATLEYIGLPSDLSCYVIGRSSLGRTGLVIATAIAVSPGYSGCITLEIVNVGEVPLPLFPGMRVAQLVIHSTIGTAAYTGRFSCSTGPSPPALWRDREMSVWESGDR